MLKFAKPDTQGEFNNAFDDEQIDAMSCPIEDGKENRNAPPSMLTPPKLDRPDSPIYMISRKRHMAPMDCVERPLSIFFYKYGKFVARNPWIFIMMPLLFTAAMAFGILNLKEVRDAIYLFTPNNAQSKTERNIIHEKWPLYEDTYIPGRAVTQSRECQLIVKARDGANILDPVFSDAVINLNRQVINDIVVHHEGKAYRYGDMCLHWRNNPCTPNIQINYVTALLEKNRPITYPIIRPGANSSYLENQVGSVYLGSSLGNVSLIDVNGEYHLKSASAWLMIYHLQFQPENVSIITAKWEHEFQKVMLAYHNPYLEITIFHSQTLTEELARNADSLVPKFIMAFALLIVFSALNGLTLINDGFYVDWVRSRPTLSLMGCINAGLGVVVSLGLLTYLGTEFNQIVNVMPFLVIAIGVDNMFLMNAAFEHTDRSISVEHRMGEMLSDVAISITITALTDALSFGVGTITPIPAVYLFCLYTAVAIIFTFIFQLTFYLGLMCVFAYLEEKNAHTLTFGRTISPKHRSNHGLFVRLFKLGTRSFEEKETHSLHINQHHTIEESKIDHSLSTIFFRDWYTPILMEPIVRALVLLWFFVYLALAIWGCMNLSEGLKPVNLLVADSYAIPHYETMEKYFWRYGPEVQVVVNNAPDLTDPVERDKLRRVISAFANTEHTIGERGVQYWLNEMQQWFEWNGPSNKRNLDDNDPDLFYYFARNFFDNINRWEDDVHWENYSTRDRIDSFRFIVGMRNFATTKEQTETTFMLREVASRYPQYNISTFMPVWLFTDQYSMVLPNTLQNIGIAVICMVIIALMLIPQPICALCVAICIVSIDVGVIGYMTWWDVSLDAISMITIIMSIGFSVDFSAHVTYGYVVAEEEEPKKRVQLALAQLGWPICQGAISTVIGVSVLAPVNAYMIVTFFKTVFLVIVLGVLHGLVFLPVFLSLFVRGCCVSRRKKYNPEKDLHRRPISSSDLQMNGVRPVDYNAVNCFY